MTLTTPPVAPKKPHVETHHGITITDDYFWLRDPGYPEVSDPEILAHLKAENAWFESRMAPHKGRIDALFTEMRGRIKGRTNRSRRRTGITSIGSSSRKVPNTRNGGVARWLAARTN